VKVTVCPETGLLGLIVKLAVNAPGGETVIECDEVATVPKLSVIVRVTVKEPELVYVWLDD
jgi:hypothetical protein